MMHPLILLTIIIIIVIIVAVVVALICGTSEGWDGAPYGVDEGVI